ncbi:hypothetical protein GCM10022240_06800 [Microbacterium kribbense]|uniref:YCII-related domain-containing protein n=1 Tax=Microbacterium kribbense TaxID=433645 RepID=A0ABP7G608_9MICO
MPTFAVTYYYADNSEQRRNQHRPDHVAFLHGLHDEGILYMSGAMATEPPRALLVLEADDQSALEARLDQDPFFVNGLVGRRDVSVWSVFFDPREQHQR